MRGTGRQASEGAGRVAWRLALTFAAPLCKNPPREYPLTYPTTDGENAPTPPTPTYSLFDSTSVGLATLLGSPIAGTTLMAVNYHRLGKGGKGAAAVAIGLVATVMAILFGNKVPYTFSTVVAIGLLLMTRSCAQVLQGPAVTDHVSQGGKLGSRWAAAGIGVAVLVALVAVTGAGMTFVKWELAPADSGKVTIGTRDDVYYSRSVTEKEARGLGEKLKEIGYFTDRGVTVFLAKDSSGTVVSFAVKDGAWEQPEMVLAFEQIGGGVARLLGESPIKVRMINTNREVKKEMTAGEVISGTKDAIFFTGSATEADARALGPALVTAGYLLDNGANVTLSKGEGTVISLVVSDTAWEKPENIVPYENTIRQVASSVGGLPIKLRLLNASLATQREVTVQ